jgi:hypothetical protein
MHPKLEAESGDKSPHSTKKAACGHCARMRLQIARVYGSLLNNLHVLGAGTLRPTTFFVFNELPLAEALVAGPFQRRVVKEDISSFTLAESTSQFCPLLDRTLPQFATPSKTTVKRNTATRSSERATTERNGAKQDIPQSKRQLT